MAAGSTYTPIATTTLGSDTASYTFSSISGSYTDLVLISNVKVSSAGEAVQIRFNSDTGNNYSYTQLSGNGTAASSSRASSTSVIYISNDGSATNYGTAITHIMNYSNTTTYKTTLGRFAEASATSWADVGLWRSTAAITSLTINVSGTSKNLSSGSTFTLYGIAAA
jgi:hypothetical protein